MLDILPVGVGEYDTVEKIFYDFESADPLDFEIDCIRKCLDCLEELFIQNNTQSSYPNSLLNNRRKEYLTAQLFCKFCHFAETLGFISFSYMNPQSSIELYPSKKEQIKSFINNLKHLDVSDSVNFYQAINTRKESVIGEVMAYPTLLFQTKDNKDILEGSCKIIKVILNLIGEKYDILRDFYNSYKHGYRIIPCNSGGKKAFLYFDETEIPKIMVYEDEDLKKVFDLSGDCKKILQNIIENHKVRMRVGDSPDPVKVTINIFSKSGEQITKKDLDKIFYNKRKDTKKEYIIEKQILKQSDNYEEYRFKWVLFDTTDKKIIAYNKELIEMIKEFYDVNTENEVSFIKINNQFIDSLKQI